MDLRGDSGADQRLNGGARRSRYLRHYCGRYCRTNRRACLGYYGFGGGCLLSDQRLFLNGHRNLSLRSIRRLLLLAALTPGYIATVVPKLLAPTVRSDR